MPVDTAAVEREHVQINLLFEPVFLFSRMLSVLLTTDGFPPATDVDSCC